MVLRCFTLNVNHCSHISGVLDLLRHEQPDILFLQEVVQNSEELSILVNRLGYSAKSSLGDNSLPGVGAIFKNSMILENFHILQPGNLILVNFYPNLCFVNIYAPSGNINKAEKRSFFGETLFRNIRIRKNLPILIGDFNWIFI